MMQCVNLQILMKTTSMSLLKSKSLDLISKYQQQYWHFELPCGQNPCFIRRCS